MQFKSLVAATAFVATAFGAINWTSPATLACAKANWAAIKAKADPLLPSAGFLLTPEQRTLLASLLSGASTMPANPTDEWLLQLPSAIPPSVLNLVSGSIINACLVTYVPPASTTDAPTSTTEVPIPTTDAPASTTEAPVSTTEVPDSTTEAPATTTDVPASTTEAPVSSPPAKCGH